MSKIALEGNASGTGTFTIASPNSNSNYTLTLPSSTGTVVVTGGAQTIEFAAGTAASPSITFTGDTNTGIFSPGADTIAFSEGGVESMRIDSSGNVLVNTTTGYGKFTVQSNAGTGKVLLDNYVSVPTTENVMSIYADASRGYIQSYNNGYKDIAICASGGNVGIGTSTIRGRLTVSDGAVNTAGEAVYQAYIAGTSRTFTSDGTGMLTIQSTNALAANVGGSIAFGGRAVSGSDAGANWAAVSGFKENATTAEYGGYLQFATRPNSGSITERARITSGGGLWVGNTTRQSTSNHSFIQVTAGDWISNFQCNTATAANNLGVLIYYSGSAPNGTGNPFLSAQDTGGIRAEIRSNGGLANYSANNVNLSDEREKTNIELAGSYLDKICAIPVKTFNYIDQNNEDDPGLTLGVVAQDVQVVAPELVMESNWGTQEEPKMRLSIYQTDLQYALMKSIQELKAITDAQATRIEALEAEVAALKGQ